MISLIYNILVISSVLSAFISLIVSIVKSRTFNRQLKVLLLYLTISLSTDIVTTFYSYPIIALIFTIIEFTLIVYIYWLELERKVFRIIIYTLYVIFLILTAFSVFYFKDFDQADAISSTSEAIIIISLGIMYFFKVFSDLDIPKLTNYYYFWLNSAFLLYFSTALFLFISKNYIKGTDPMIGHFLWGIHLIINITFNILLIIGICKHRKI